MAFNAKRNDVEAFIEGVWKGIDGGQFRIARAGNPEYESALEASGYRNTDDPADKQRRFYEAVAKGIIKDWADVVDDEGKDIPFTVRNAVMVLEENPDLLGKILKEANDLSNYRRQDVDAQAKKPRAGSASRASGARTRKERDASTGE